MHERIRYSKEAFIPVWQEKKPLEVKATQGSAQYCRYHHPFDLKREILLVREDPWGYSRC